MVVEPAVGRLTGADTGKGRLPEPAEIFALATRLLAAAGQRPDLAGRRVVVTAGGTREPLDPVRFLGNRSSGRQGYALRPYRRGAGRQRHGGGGQCDAARSGRGRRWSASGPPSELRDADLAAADGRMWW